MYTGEALADGVDAAEALQQEAKVRCGDPEDLDVDVLGDQVEEAIAHPSSDDDRPPAAIPDGAGDFGGERRRKGSVRHAWVVCMLPWREQLDNRGGPLGIARWASAALAVALLIAAAPLAARRAGAGGPVLHQVAAAVPRDIQADPREPHLRNLRMLTDGGENAEAYFSFDGRKIIFQSTRRGMGAIRSSR